MGWTDVEPSGNKQRIVDSNDLPILTWATIVNESLDLYPVFITGGITVNSNIDNILDNAETVRYVQKQIMNFRSQQKNIQDMYLKDGIQVMGQITKRR